MTAPDCFFTGIPNSVLDHVTELKPPSCAWGVLLHLHRRANRDGASWWSVKRMAESCGMSRASVIRGISWLEAQGLIRVERSNGDNSVYFLLPVAKLQPVAEMQPGGIRNATGTGSRNATALYIRTEEEPIEEEPKKKNQRARNVLALVSTLEIPPDLEPHRVPIENWIAYKKESGKTYKPRGLSALWGRLRKLKDIPSAIEDSMACMYAGIFDVSDKNKPRRETQGEHFRRLMGDA